MKSSAVIHVAFVTLSLLPVFLFSGCDRGEEKGVLERIELEDEEGTVERNQRDQTPDEIRDLPASVFVEPEEESPFRTLARTDHLKRYPCSGCHISDEQVRSNPEVNPNDRRAHWKQSLDHGQEDDMDCSTCHGSEPVDKLETPRNKPVSFDRPDRTCQSCHGKQVRDWMGGAHGKQHKYWDWSEEPVRFNCTTCHDPHDPSFKKRWPATSPNIPRSSRKQPGPPSDSTSEPSH